MARDRILVVEDDTTILEVLRYNLVREDHDVITAVDGAQALEQARKESPDLIILDIMLPGLDGYDICERVRTNPETEKIPIIMTSGKTLQEDKDIGIKLGASVYLTKPVPPSEMLTNVKTLLGEE